MKSAGKLAGRSLSQALPDERWLQTSREDAGGASKVVSEQRSTPGPRSPAGAIPELLPHAPDQEWLRPGIEPPQRQLFRVLSLQSSMCGSNAISDIFISVLTPLPSIFLPIFLGFTARPFNQHHCFSPPSCLQG